MNDANEPSHEDNESDDSEARASFLPNGPKAAYASWTIPIIAMLGSCVWRIMLRNSTEDIDNSSQISAIATALAVMTALVCGLILSIHALRSMRKYGRKGVMVQAIFGLLLNSVLLFAMIYGAILPYTGHLDGSWKQVYATAGEGYTPDYVVDMKGAVREEADKGTHPNGVTIFLYTKHAVSSLGHVLMRVLQVSAFQDNGIITNYDPLFEDVIDKTLAQFSGTEISREHVSEDDMRMIVEGTTRRPHGRIRIELYHRGPSVYGVIYFAEDGDWSQEDADRFFSSFQLLD